MTTKLFIEVDENIKDLYQNHSTYNEGDSKLDLFFPEDIVFYPGESKIIDLKIKCKMFSIDNNCSFYIYPIVNIYNTPLIMSNSIYVIDSANQHSIKVGLRHIPTDYLEKYIINKSDILFQIYHPNLAPFTFELVDDIRLV